MNVLSRLAWLTALLSTSVGMALAGETTNPIGDSHPVEVDGLPGGNEYSGTSSSGFISGSLYQATLNDPLLNSSALMRISRDADEINPDWAMFGLFSFGRRTTLGFGEGEFISDIKFPITYGGVSYPNFILSIRGAAGGGIYAGADMDGNGTIDMLAFNLGIKAAIALGVTPDMPETPHLLIEIKVPLSIPRKFGRPFPTRGQEGILSPGVTLWYGTAAADNGIGEQSLFTTSVGRGGSTLINTDTAPVRLEVDVKPGNQDNTINSTENGTVPVGIISYYALDATTVDWRSLRMGDEFLSGRVPASNSTIKDINGDGVMDMLVHFDLYAGSGALSNSTQMVVVEGMTLSGGLVSGKDRLRIVN